MKSSLRLQDLSPGGQLLWPLPQQSQPPLSPLGGRLAAVATAAVAAAAAAAADVGNRNRRVHHRSESVACLQAADSSPGRVRSSSSGGASGGPSGSPGGSRRRCLPNLPAGVNEMTEGGRRESTVSALPSSPGASAGSWARRKAMMNAFRMKSISMDEADRQHPTDQQQQQQQQQQSPQHRMEKPRDLPLASRAQPQPPQQPSGSRAAQSGRRMLDSRMKSISVDNPDQVSDQVQMLRLDDEARKKSSSFTNTNFIESQVPPSPKRKKQLFGRNKSFSVEQENSGIRRVEFSEESVGRRGLSPRHSPRHSPRGSPGRGSPGRGSPNSPKSTATASPPHTSPRRSPGYASAASSSGVGLPAPEKSPQRSSPGRDKDMSKQIGKRRLQWKMKSFSLDTPDPKHNLEVDEFEVAAAAATAAAAAPPSGSGMAAAHRGAVGGGGYAPGSGAVYGDRGYRAGDRGEGSKDRGSAARMNFQHGHGREEDDLSRYGASGYTDQKFEQPTQVHSYLGQMQPQRSRKMLRESRLSGNLYVVLYDFKARHRDEMDLKAGFKLSCIEMTDQDWWRGKCMGRIGLFPAAYVQKIRDGDIIWRVLSPLTTSTACGSTVKLYRGQIVVQQAQRKSPHYVPITLKDGRELDCPLQILERLLD